MTESKTVPARMVESINDTIEALLRQAGDTMNDRFVALRWLVKATNDRLYSMKEKIRGKGLTRLRDGSTVAEMPSKLGAIHVNYLGPRLSMSEEVSETRLRAALGDRFEDFFEVVPSIVKPRSDFLDRLDRFRGSEMIRQMLSDAVTFTPRSAKVIAPRAPRLR